MNINDKVFINIPIQAGGIISKNMRVHNHTAATIIGKVDGYYKLNVDNGRFLWPASVLGVIMPKAIR